MTAFRCRAREWLAAEAPRRGWMPMAPVPLAGADDRGAEAAELERSRACQQALCSAGFGAITYPSEYGGQGLGIQEQIEFNEEATAYNLPLSELVVGLGVCAPTLLALGTEEQKARYLQPLLHAEEIWCQLFSEPGAGSDVASLVTRAVGDAAIGMEGRRPEGMDLRCPQCRLRVTPGANGPDGGAEARRPDDVHRRHDVAGHHRAAPPADGRHRPLQRGVPRRRPRPSRPPRRQAERGLGGRAREPDERTRQPRHDARDGRDGSRCRDALGAARRRGLAADPVLRQELVDVVIRERVLSYVGKRINAAMLAGREPGPEGSIAKLFDSDLLRRAAAVGARIHGPATAAWQPACNADRAWGRAVLFAPGMRIAGGTDEIQRNTLAERALGLPR